MVKYFKLRFVAVFTALVIVTNTAVSGDSLCESRKSSYRTYEDVYRFFLDSNSKTRNFGHPSEYKNNNGDVVYVWGDSNHSPLRSYILSPKFDQGLDELKQWQILDEVVKNIGDESEQNIKSKAIYSSESASIYGGTRATYYSLVSSRESIKYSALVTQNGFFTLGRPIDFNGVDEISDLSVFDGSDIIQLALVRTPYTVEKICPGGLKLLVTSQVVQHSSSKPVAGLPGKYSILITFMSYLKQ